jgi:NAD(P)-dependent dehydrogenase (short-subunit alcohol dehydrogenase family)
MTRRSWLIIGVNSGFGRVTTEQLLARGDRGAGTVRNLATMDDLKAEHGDLHWVAELDLAECPRSAASSTAPTPLLAGSRSSS